ncbi:MAG TPA: D-aminoacyl-tRNA deacylase [Tepidisphaeraceae bacterium]|nr:D-aminoacyl-tRNA deacylase [Tepidisphaeraceae bacterium]
MIAVVQRVTGASVKVGTVTVGEIGNGLLALVSIVREDDAQDVAWMASKLASLRIFRGDAGSGERAGEQKHFDRSVSDIGGAILLVSNFTVAADTKRGRRPSFDRAAAPESGRVLFDHLIASLRATGVPVATGEFGGDMRVSLVNDGPATFIVSSRG